MRKAVPLRKAYPPDWGLSRKDANEAGPLRAWPNTRFYGRAEFEAEPGGWLPVGTAVGEELTPTLIFG